MPRVLTAVPTGNQTRQWELAGGDAIKIRVQRTGWYRVTQAQLVAAGLDPAVTPRSLQLFAEGNEVPIVVSGQNKAKLGTGDYIEFYGMALNMPTTGEHVYWLRGGVGTGLRIAATPTGTPGATAVASFLNVTETSPRSIYYSFLLNGAASNFFGPVVNSLGFTQDLQVSDLAANAGPSNAATLEISLQGVSTASHIIKVQFNNVLLGTISFTGAIRYAAKLPVPQSALHAGQNTLKLVTNSEQRDVSLLDYIRLIYPRRYHAVNNTLTFTAPGRQTVSLDGLSSPSIRVLDVTDANAVAEVLPRVAPDKHSTSFKVPGVGVHTLLALPTGQFMIPAAVERNNPSTWHTGHSADLVIISHAAFMAAAAPLAAHRQQQGLAVQTIDVEDLYDEFNYGMHDPIAIKAFLSRSKGLWSKSPRFVLLLGDSSVDPRNYFGDGNSDFVPTKLIDTSVLETTSDDWLADFNNDGLPEMAVGRLPVRTSSQAATVINKIVNYNGVPATNPPQSAVFVSDTERGYDFKGANDALAALLPSSVPIVKINRGDADDATTHDRIVAAFNQGPLLVNYVGHGSLDIWTGAKLLASTDAPGLTNGQRLPIVLCSNCLNGYFIDPVTESLAEALLKAPHGGAIAVWASSGETFPDQQEKMSQAFFKLMFQTLESERPRTIGEAVVKAKAATSDLDVRRTWILFGDPSTELPLIPAPQTTTSTTANDQAAKKNDQAAADNVGRNIPFLWPYALSPSGWLVIPVISETSSQGSS